MKGEFFLSGQTYENILKLSPTDKLLLQEMEKKEIFNPENSSQFLVKVKELKIDTIVRLAQHNLKFKLSCQRQQKELNDYWTCLWSAYGIVLKKDHKRFYDYETSSWFNRLRGAYFYFESRKAQEAARRDFAYTEIKHLEKAVSYHCIHAVQRYNQYLYKAIAELKSNDSTIDEYYQKIINNCASTVSHYACYSYFMLAEAYFQYAQWLHQNKSVDEAQEYYQAAIQSCTYAQSTFVASEHAIDDASLGHGLASSNSLKISTPEIAMAWLQKNCLQNVSNGPTKPIGGFK
jgi:uncharacterized protein DUF5630